jgi:hypothetical protein
MGLPFTLGMLLFYLVALRGPRSGELAKLLWLLYLGLGVSASIADLTGALNPVFERNFGAAAFLLGCILLSILGFRAFRSEGIGPLLQTAPRHSLIEAGLIGLQMYSLLFFLPFAVTSLQGDASENRLELASKMDLLASYGLFNTVAGAAAQLFTASLVFGFLRLALPQGQGRSVGRAAVLIGSSFCYVVYIFAYVGRDGVVYWLMSALATFLVFRPHLPPATRRRLVAAGTAMAAVLAFPFVIITVARFADSDIGSGWSVLEYFGQQINHFSDFSNIERPLTLGLMSFPMLAGAACSVAGLACEQWDDLRPLVFDQYLVQGKEPWLFGTFVSDFVGDFGIAGAAVLVTLLALASHRASRTGPRAGPMTMARLLLAMFLFLVPYWGVFYFRFSIGNGFIVLHLLLVALVWAATRMRPSQSPYARAANRDAGGSSAPLACPPHD